MLEPADSARSARDFAKRAFELSEEYDTPVFSKLCTRISHSQSILELGQRVEPARRPYEKDIAKYVMVPGNARPRHPIVEERTRRLTAFAETTDLNREEMGEDTSIGIVTSSTSYQYAREVFGPKASILKLGLVNPLPKQKILDFAAKVDKVLVLEELDPVIEDHCRALGLDVLGKDVLPLEGEFSQGLVAAKAGQARQALGGPGEEPSPAVPPCCAPDVPTAACSTPWPSTRSRCWATSAATPWPPTSRCTPLRPAECMGASVSSIHGFNKALEKESEGKTVAVLGDSTFMHSGMTGLANIAYNQRQLHRASSWTTPPPA